MIIFASQSRGEKKSVSVRVGSRDARCHRPSPSRQQRRWQCVYAEQVHQRQRGSRSAIEWSEQILDYKVNIIIQVKLSYESTLKKKDTAAKNDNALFIYLLSRFI